MIHENENGLICERTMRQIVTQEEERGTPSTWREYFSTLLARHKRSWKNFSAGTFRHVFFGFTPT